MSGICVACPALDWVGYYEMCSLPSPFQPAVYYDKDTK